MKKTAKTRPPQKNRPARKPKAARQGIPTAEQRLEMIRGAIEMIGTGIGVDYDTFCSLKPDVKGIDLSAEKVRVLASLISVCYENAYWLSESLPPDVLEAFAPTDEQKEVFEQIEISGGAR